MPAKAGIQWPLSLVNAHHRGYWVGGFKPGDDKPVVGSYTEPSIQRGTAVLDVKWIRDNRDAFIKGLTDRGFEASARATLNRILNLDEQRRSAIQKLQDAQARRNAASKEIGKAKASKDEKSAQRLMDEVAALKGTIQEGEAEEKRLDDELRNLLAAIPNNPAPDVPIGPDADANVVLRKFGEPKKFPFQPKQHFEIGEALGLMDFETAAKLSGARFVVLKGPLARLERALAQFMSSAIQASIETIRRRVDAFGTTEPSIQREGRNRVLVQVPGISDVERLKTLIGETGKLEFKLVDPSANAEQIAQSKVVPPGDELLYGNPPSGAPKGTPQIPYVLRNQVLVTGQNLVDAQPSFDQRTGEPVVTFRFDAAGATRFGKVTQENVGLPFAIILDNKVISAPVIREPILGGTGQISGHFTVQEANDLAVLLRSGALPAKLTVIEERTVGASLGADSIESGKKAALMGLTLVMIFMLAGYGLFGLFANVALLINIALIFAVLSLMGATLTLPGIAGIVLTIGIAVDANVLINERIREEIRAGKSPFAAVDAGYSRALITIIDSNVTTLIAVLVLFWLGSGPVRGFAVTLTVGVLASMFTAVTVTRLMVAYWLRWTRPQLIPI